MSQSSTACRNSPTATSVPRPNGFHRHHQAVVDFCRTHGVQGYVTYSTIWVRTHGQADDLTTLLAREWDSVYPQPVIGVHPVYGADDDNADDE